MMNTLENNNATATSNDSAERNSFKGGVDNLQSARDEIFNLLRNKQNAGSSDNIAGNPSSASAHLPGLELHDAGEAGTRNVSSSANESRPIKPSEGSSASAPGATDAPPSPGSRAKSGSDILASGSAAGHAAISARATDSSTSPVGDRATFSHF